MQSIVELELRRKREEFSIELRSLKRQDILKKKRNTYITPSSSLFLSKSDKFLTEIQKSDLQEQMNFYSSREFSIFDLPKLIEFAKSSEILQQHYASVGIRKLLSLGLILYHKNNNETLLENGSPIQQIIDSGLVPVLISNLYQIDYPYLQRDSAWALTNIAAGSTLQTQMILEKGALLPLMALLKSNVEDLYEQAIWAIGNIAGDNTSFRDQILDGGVEDLVKIGLETKNFLVFKNVTWALSNLSRGRPGPEYGKVKEAGKVFGLAIMKYANDEEAVVDSLWALSCLSGNFVGMERFFNGGF